MLQYTAMGILYIVATPIGNLQDITLRAIRTIFEVDVIACEDTRRTGVLLHALQPQYNLLAHNGHREREHPKLLSYYDEVELRRIPEILSLLHNDQSVALVSDAGTPAISDPGFKLIRACVQEGIKVEVIPGPSSVISALAVSGLPTDKFLFLGYPPRKSGHRMNFFAAIKDTQKVIKTTVLLFEAPHRLIGTLSELHKTFGEIEIVTCRELTKIHEEVRKEQISAAITHFSHTSPKGEFVLLFNLGK